VRQARPVEATVVTAMPFFRPGLLRAVVRVTVGLSRRERKLSTTMAKQRSHRRQSKSKPKPSRAPLRDGPSDDTPAEAMTVAWTASVMSVLMANLATIAAHFYTRFHPDSKTAPPFEAIMLLTACLLGLASLALLAVVWRTSRLKPPRGFIVFAMLVAVAPIVVTIARLTVR
jgi:hypothetical protein